jgi:hypothetical protein
MGLRMALGLSALLLLGGCSWFRRKPPAPTMASLPEAAPPFRQAVLCVNAELQRRGIPPGALLPEIYELDNGFILFHLRNADREGGLDLGYDRQRRAVVGVSEWQGKASTRGIDAKKVLAAMLEKH